MAIDTMAPTALAVPRIAAPAVRKPTTIRFAVTATALGIISSGLVVPYAAMVLISVVGFLGLGSALVRSEAVRDARVAWAARRAKAARRDARERALPATSFGREILSELTQLVDVVEARDPELAARLDLEALLDRHVSLTIGHTRALHAVSMSDRIQLERVRDSHRSDPAANARRLELCERRLRLHHECEARAEWFADELAILTDLIRLIAQRAATPDDLAGDDAIERRLAELDEREAASLLIADELGT